MRPTLTPFPRTFTDYALLFLQFLLAVALGIAAMVVAWAISVVLQHFAVTKPPVPILRDSTTLTAFAFLLPAAVSVPFILVRTPLPLRYSIPLMLAIVPIILITLPTITAATNAGILVLLHFGLSFILTVVAFFVNLPLYTLHRPTTSAPPPILNTLPI